jgi:hypothetical protein
MKIHELLDEGPIWDRLKANFKTGYEVGRGTSILPWGKNYKPKPSKTKSQSSYSEQQRLERKQKEIQDDYTADMKRAETIPDSFEKENAKKEAARRRQLALNNLTNPTSESYLREHSTNILDNLTLMLRNLILSANNQGLPSKFSYLAISELLTPLFGDIKFNKENFKQLIDNHPNLSKYIKIEIQNDGVTLQTDAEFKPEQALDNQIPDVGTGENSTVAAMASRGAQYVAKSRNNP